MEKPTKLYTTHMEEEEDQKNNNKNRILEITLISAQSLKPPSAKLRRLQTYALAWVHPSAKLRTKIDNVGGENPTWNEKFLFRVSTDFIARETSGVSVEIYAIGYIKDVLVGRVNFLLSSCLKSNNNNKSGRVSIRTPAFSAVHIRRPSGSFSGVVNLAATVYNVSEFSTVLAGTTASAVCFRELIDENDRRRRKEERRLNRGGSKRSEQSSDADSCDFSCGDSFDFSDGTDSTTSSSSNTSTAFKDWNGVRSEKLAGKKSFRQSDGGGGGPGLLCGLMLQRRMSWCPPSDQNLQFFAGLQGRK